MNQLNFTLYLLITCLSQVHADQAVIVENEEITRVLAFSEEISSSDSLRIYTVFDSYGECWGKIESCPDIDLYITFLPDLMYEPAKLYSLPQAKGWEFVEWLETKSHPKHGKLYGLTLRTTIPNSNIEPSEREKWKSDLYEVWVNYRHAEYNILN